MEVDKRLVEHPAFVVGGGTYTGSPKWVRRASWITSERVRCSILRARSTMSNSSSGSVTATFLTAIVALSRKRV